MTVTFSVRGRPVTQGSKVTGINQKTGFAFMKEVNASSLMDWRRAIGDAAREAMAGQPLMTGPVKVTATFLLRRPASAPKRKRTWPIGPRSGDLDKYMRALGDALSSVVFDDDCQIVELLIRKDFAVPPAAPGVNVCVKEIS